MYNIICQIETFLRGMWRFNWWGIGVSWIVFVAGTLLVLSMPDQYKTKSSFYVKGYSVIEPILRDLTVQSDVAEHAYILSEAILSRSILEELVLESGLSERLSKAGDIQSMVEHLQANIKITSERDNLYDIEYVDRDPQVSFQVVDLLLNRFLNKVLSGKVADASIAEDFIEKQILIYEKKLTESEERLAEFKKQHIEEMPSANSNSIQKLKFAQEELDTARIELRKATGKRNELRRQINGESPTVGMLGINSPSQQLSNPISAQIDQIQTQMNKDLLKYTENHPKILAARNTISQLQQKIEHNKSIPASERSPSIYGSGGSSAANANIKANPIYQSVFIALRRAETEVATLQATVNEHLRKVASMRNSLDEVTEVEAELARLDRDYGVNKNQYTELVRRLEMARMSQEAEKSDDSIKFQIIDSPIVPKSPIGPQRPLFISAVLLMSIAIGAAFALFLDQARPVFLTTHHLSRETSLPVYGAVTLKLTEEKLRAERTTMAAFVMLVILMFGFYSISVMKHEAGASLLSSYVTK